MCTDDAEWSHEDETSATWNMDHDSSSSFNVTGESIGKVSSIDEERPEECWD